MKKNDIIEHYLRSEMLTDRIWDAWLDWRAEQPAFIGTDAAYGMPADFKWIPDANGTMLFTWEGGQEEVPLSVFYDDKQPDLEMVWHSGYHDGPLNGVALYNGDFVWFEYEDEGEETGIRTFAIYKLHPEVFVELKRRHEMFQTKVGYHNDHHPDTFKRFGMANKTEFDEFYETAKKWSKFDHAENDKLGVFPYHQFKYYARPR